MGFLSQGVPNLVPWLIFRAWRGGRWDFRLWLFFRSVFWVLHWKTSVFRFWCPLQFFGFLASAFLAKIKHVTDFSLCCESVVLSDVKLFLCLRFTVVCASPSVSVYERKKGTRSERGTRAAKTRLLSLPSSHAVFALFFDPLGFPHYLGAWNRLGWQLLRAFCELKIAPIVLYCYSIEDLCEFL